VQRGAQRQVNQDLLRQFGIYYAAYRSENGRPPRTLDEFRDYLKSDPNARNQMAKKHAHQRVFLPVHGTTALALKVEIASVASRAVLCSSISHSRRGHGKL
jgi:hypothetical protein